MTLLLDLKENISDQNDTQKRISLFSYVQNLSYQINWLSKPEEVINAWAWYCLSKHRLLKQLFQEVWIESNLCYVSFSFWNVWLPKHLQGWWMATKDWYHVFLEAKIQWEAICVDASFPMRFSDIYPTSKERDWIHSMTPFWWPCENRVVCTSKEEENSAKKEFTKNTLLDSDNEKRIDEFNSRSLSISMK